MKCVLTIQDATLFATFARPRPHPLAISRTIGCCAVNTSDDMGRLADQYTLCESALDSGRTSQVPCVHPRRYSKRLSSPGSSLTAKGPELAVDAPDLP